MANGRQIGHCAVPHQNRIDLMKNKTLPYIDMLRVAREYGKFRKHKMIPSYRFSQFKIFSVILKPVSANSGTMISRNRDFKYRRIYR